MFIKCILKRESIDLIHYPIERMITDYFTKPLKGSLFRKMRDIIMGLDDFPDEERIELHEKVTNISYGQYKMCVIEKYVLKTQM